MHKLVVLSKQWMQHLQHRVCEPIVCVCVCRVCFKREGWGVGGQEREGERVKHTVSHTVFGVVTHDVYVRYSLLLVL
jgi:hypothetical protein